MESKHSVNSEGFEYKWGEVTFSIARVFDKASVEFTIVPYGYLARDQETQRIYMFETAKDMEDYFTDFSLPQK